MKIGILLFVWLSSYAVAGGEPGPGAHDKLDLATAESIALRYSPHISEAYFKAEAAREKVLETRSNLYPQITGVATAVGTGTEIANEFGGGQRSATQTTRIGASGGLNNPSIYSRESNGLLVSQLITDFGRTPNLISAARYQSLSEAEKTKLARAQVILQVDEAFFKILGAEALLRVANETVDARQLTVDQVSALTKSSLKSELDLSFARVDLENANLLVLQAKSAVGDANAELSAALGYRGQHQFQLVEDVSYPPLEPDMEKLVAQALQFRPELVALRDELRGAEKFTAAEREAHFPVITALGSAGRTPIGDASVEGNYSAAGINVEVPIFTGGLLTARYHEAQDRAKAVQKAVQDVEDEIVKDVHEEWLDATTAIRKIQVTKALLSSSAEALDLAQSRYKIGVTSIIELSQAQLSQTQAAIGYASALYEYQIDRVKLEFVTGALKYRTPGSSVR